MPRIFGPAIAVFIIALSLIGGAACVHANDYPALKAELRRLSSNWEHVKFQVGDRHEQERQLDLLADEAADILQRHQSEPDAMIWLKSLSASRPRSRTRMGVRGRLSVVQSERAIFLKQ